MDPAHTTPADDTYTKLFVSDLPQNVTSDELREHFSKFGELGEVTVKHGGEARAHYGFVWTVTAATAMAIMSQPHTIGDHGQIPAPVLARNRRRAANGVRKFESAQPADPRCSPDKIFVGGLSNDTTIDDYRAYFDKFGTIKDAIIMRDRTTNRSRGFGFVTFVDSASVTAVLAEQYHELDGRKVEVKPAMPKQYLADDDSTSVAGSLYGRAFSEPGYMETAMGYMPHLGIPFGMMPPVDGPPLPQTPGPATHGIRVTEEGEEMPEAANDSLSGSMEGMSLSGKGGQPMAPPPAAASSQADQWSPAGMPTMGGMSSMPAHIFVQMPPQSFGGYPPPPALGMVPMPGGPPPMGMMPMMGAPHPVMMVGMPVGGPVAYAPGGPGPAGPYQHHMNYMVPPHKGRNGGWGY